MVSLATNTQFCATCKAHNTRSSDPVLKAPISVFILADLTNIFESFLPQLLAYPNPIDPLNGDAAAMYLHRPEDYKQKIKGDLKCLVVSGVMCIIIRVLRK